MFCFISALWLAATCLDIATSSVLSTTKVTTCDTEDNVHRLSCERGVIAVQAALYGRLDKETCSDGWTNHLSDITCSQRGAKEMLQRRCDGGRTCEIPIQAFRFSDPCYGMDKYLESTYACVGHGGYQPAVISSVVCENSIAHLHCGQGQVIHVFSAFYGRTDRYTCSYKRPWYEVQNVHCRGYVKPRVAQKCDGHSSCSVKASGTLFGDSCRGTYKYMEIKYSCRRAADCSRYGCFTHFSHDVAVLEASVTGGNDTTVNTDLNSPENSISHHS